MTDSFLAVLVKLFATSLVTADCLYVCNVFPYAYQQSQPMTITTGMLGLPHGQQDLYVRYSRSNREYILESGLLRKLDSSGIISEFVKRKGECTKTFYYLVSPLSPSITPSLFHSKLKTYLFGKSFPT